MVGHHIIIDLKFPNSELLTHEGNFLPEMLSACVDAQTHVLNSFYHDFGSGHGYTFIISLAESHVSCHTWPEYNLACIDIFTCGETSPTLVLHHFFENLGFIPEIYDETILERGTNAITSHSTNNIDY